MSLGASYPPSSGGGGVGYSGEVTISANTLTSGNIAHGMTGTPDANEIHINHKQKDTNHVYLVSVDGTNFVIGQKSKKMNDMKYGVTIQS